MYIVHDRILTGIDLNLLPVLRALLAERHVTRAARRVGLSQSATSHALARLRQLLGDPLLVRSGRALVVTPRAARLLPALEHSLAAIERVVTSEPEFDPSNSQRTFTLGMADYLQALIAGALVRELAQHAPGVDLSIVVFPNLRELVESGGLDLALSLVEPEHAGEAQESLFDEDYLCMVRRDHPRLKRALSLELYLAQRHVVVAPTGTPGSLVDDLLVQRGLRRRIALRVTNFLIAPVVVCQTDLVSILPARLARQFAKTYPLRLLRPPLDLPKFSFGMFWHTRYEHDPAHRWLREFVGRVSRSC